MPKVAKEGKALAPAQVQDESNLSYSPISGCGNYVDHYYLNALGEYRPAYRSWCGSDEVDWYSTDDWCLYFGICARDYGIKHE